MQFPALIKEVGRGARGARDLDPERAQALFGAMLDGTVPEMELGALLLDKARVYAALASSTRSKTHRIPHAIASTTPYAATLKTQPKGRSCTRVPWSSTGRVRISA